jgi:hypothetical protein
VTHRLNPVSEAARVGARMVGAHAKL